MKKAIVIGHFAWKENAMIGATIKARNILKQLQSEYGNDNIGSVDIYKWRNNFFSVLLTIVFSFTKSKNIVFVCSDTSAILLLLYRTLKRIFRCRLFYCVVGGDFAELIEKAGTQKIHRLNVIDWFLVETFDCFNDLNRLGFKNTKLMKNFKCIVPVTSKKLREKETNNPLKLCTFSRVVEEKGISDAICAVEDINTYHKMECELTVYGQVDSGYKNTFEGLIEESKHSHYGGIIDSNMAVEILQEYDILLFPTKFQTEGIPGTIIDAFAAGLPIICSDWVRRKELITDELNGIVYPFGSYEGLVESIVKLISNPELRKKLAVESLKSFDNYSAKEAIKPLTDLL